MKALVVEDEAGMARILKTWLEKLGLEVQITDTLDSAAKIIATPPVPEVITLDLNLLDSPVQDTISRVKEIRSLTPEALLLIVSGVMTDYDKIRLTTMGADATIEKLDIGTEKSFLTKLGEVWKGLIGKPQDHLRNFPLMEVLAKRVTDRYNELKIPLGTTETPLDKPPETK